jgi:DNA-binding transcriptional LysR family regulator
VEPTEAGRSLVRHVRSLHAQLHALESEVVEFKQGIKGHLRIAANAGAISECLPPDLAAFSQAHPQIRISLEDLTSAETQAAVAEGRADVGIFVPPVLDNRLSCRTYRHGALAAMVPAGHELSTCHAVRFEQLLDHDIVGLHHGAAVQELMRAEAEGQGKPLKAHLQARLQVRGFDAIAQLVEAGLGVAVMPAAVAHRFAQLFRVQVLALDEAWAERDYLMAVRTQEVLPAVVQRFLDALCPLSPPPMAATPISVPGQSAAERPKP